MYSSNVFLLYSSDVFVKCILCILHCILSQACRGVSEAEEMLVTQMSNVARNEIASPPPHWQNILNVYQIFIKCQFIKHFYYYLSDIIKESQIFDTNIKCCKE